MFVYGNVSVAKTDINCVIIVKSVLHLCSTQRQMSSLCFEESLLFVSSDAYRYLKCTSHYMEYLSSPD